MRYRSDYSENQPDGAKLWYTRWIGGPSLAKVQNCRLDNLEGDMRRTVTITGEADSWFSQPAMCRLQGCKLNGYVTGDSDGCLVFRHCYY